MNGWRAWLAAAVLACGFTWGMLRLFGVQYSTGDVYPEYSSLRSDPLGSRLMFESLARLPGLRVTRNYLPLEYFSAEPSALLLLGVSRELLQRAEFTHLVERLAGRGHRAIVALAEAAPRKQAGAPENPWHIQLGGDPRDQYIAAAPGWKILEGPAGRARAVERGFGKGTVVLFAASDLFANASTLQFKRLAAVSAAIGANAGVVFDESHFGIAESGSVVGLARRYRLMGLALGLALLGALALWRNASAFPPRGGMQEPERLWGRTSFAGLVTLLRRHVPAAELAPVCWQEWLKINRREISAARARKAAALAAAHAARPLEAVREIQAVLRAKGEL